jgi:hypothetical protein
LLARPGAVIVAEVENVLDESFCSLRFSSNLLILSEMTFVATPVVTVTMMVTSSVGS